MVAHTDPQTTPQIDPQATRPEFDSTVDGSQCEHPDNPSTDSARTIPGRPEPDPKDLGAGTVD
eukprot:4265889-Pyramimonas_sp.AAC.1